jgi:arylsulfatase A-like enzyme
MRRDRVTALRCLLVGAVLGALAGAGVAGWLVTVEQRYLASGLRWLAWLELRAWIGRAGLLGLAVGTGAALPWLLARGASERAARQSRVLAALGVGTASVWLVFGRELFVRWLAVTPLWRQGLEGALLLVASLLGATLLVALARSERPRTHWGVVVLAGAALGVAGIGTLRPRPAGPSLLLISVDTLRSDRLGSYGYAPARTPSIDELARGGTLFETVIASAPVTLPSMATLLSGLDPQDHGAHYNGFYRVSRDVVTLAELLRDRGYRTGAAVGNFALDSSFRIDQGFEWFDDRMTHYMLGGRPGHTGGGGTWWSEVVNTRPFQRLASEITDSGTAWLERHGDEPFFLWLHYMDPHKPYDPPIAYRSGDAYDGEIAYVDAEIGRLLADYRLRFPEAQTLVAFVADHGESLGEHGATGHVRVLYEQTLRIPFVLNLAGRVPRGVRIREPLRGRDVPLEILRALELDPGPFAAAARRAQVGSAAATGSTPLWWAYSETYQPHIERGEPPLRSIRTERWKYIRQAGQPGELYDLSSDRGELHDRLEAEPERTEALRGVLALESRGGDAAPRPVDPETLERLRALGYVK